MGSNNPILIIGMHRSGTSMITNLLGDSGLFLGDASKLIGVNPDYLSDNPKGYWEFKPAIELSEKVLTKLGGTWNRPPEDIGSFVFEKEKFEEEITYAREIFSSFGDAQAPWGWKDPRNSLLIDFWKLVFPELKLLVCLRNPIEVAFSLSKRAIAHINFTEGLRLWELYNKVIMQKIEQYPSLVTHYESYFYAPYEESARVGKFIGLDKRPEFQKQDIQNIIDPKLYRGIVPSISKLDDLVPFEIQQLYETMGGYAGEVFSRLLNDQDYQKEKFQTSSKQLINSATRTFDEFYTRLEKQQVIADEAVRRFEIRSKEFEDDKQRLLEENFQLGVEINQIKSSRSWKFLNKFKPIYGRIYWTLAKIFKFGYRDVNHSEDPISEWIRKRLATPEELEEQKLAVSSFEKQPLFSFITPVYNPPVEIFKALIQSILDQTYSNWELCLADGGNDPVIRSMIQKLSEQDPRIKFIKLDQNLGISGNSNQALALAEGEFIVICDHDDLVEPNLLFEAVKLINETPSVDMIYYDEDKLDVSGNHFSPFLKPATIAPELLISINYLTHSIIRRKLIEEIGGFNSDADGAQDWDIFLHIVEKTQNIYHIGKILYHWRSVESSAASGDHIKPYALAAQKLAIEGHLGRIGLPDAEYKIRNHVRRVNWGFSSDEVTIIIPAVDFSVSAGDLEIFQKKIHYPDYEILLVGNKIDLSIDPSQTSKKVSVHKMEIATTAEAYNIGAELASGKYLLIGHPKMTPVEPDALSELVMWIQKPGIGIVGGKLINRVTKKIKSFGRIFGLGGFIGDLFGGIDIDSHTLIGSTMNYYNVQAVASTGLLTEKETFLEYGGFSEDLHEEFAALNYCLKILESGRRIVVNPFASFLVDTALGKISHEDILEAFALVQENKHIYQNFYNNNLSYLHIHPTLSGTKPDYFGIDLETILRRHYQSNHNMIG